MIELNISLKRKFLNYFKYKSIISAYSKSPKLGLLKTIIPHHANALPFQPHLFYTEES